MVCLGISFVPNMTAEVVSEVIYADEYTVEEIEVVAVFEDISVDTFDFETSQVEEMMVSAISSVTNDKIEEVEREALAEKIIREEREKLIEESKQYATEVKGNAMLIYDAFKPSNLTVEQYEIILEGTGLEGEGESFYKMEQEHGVNGLFAVSECSISRIRLWLL